MMAASFLAVIFRSAGRFKIDILFQWLCSASEQHGALQHFDSIKIQNVVTGLTIKDVGCKNEQGELHKQNDNMKIKYVYKIYSPISRLV